MKVTINKDSANIVTVTVTELTTLADPNYLIEFKDKLTKEYNYCLLGINRSDHTDRFDEFLITDIDPPSPLLSQVHLNEGQHIYNIYELTDAQVTALNFNAIDVTEYTLVEGDGQVIVNYAITADTNYSGASSENTFYEG